MSSYWYWSATDLVNYLPEAVIGESVVTATSRPINYSEFQTLIDLVSGEFDNAAAGNGYLTPIPSTSDPAFQYARLVIKHGAFAQVLSSIYVGDDQTLGADYRKAYEQAIADLRDGKITLAGAEFDPDSGSRLLPRGGGIASPWVSASWTP